MTTRRWMIAILAVALALGGWVMLRRRARFLQRVEEVARSERFFSHRSNIVFDDGTRLLHGRLFEADGVTMTPEAVKEFERKQAYYAGLVRKYRYAAAHPWVSVGPDGEEPD